MTSTHPTSLLPFEAMLERHDIDLRRERTATLQVNVGRLCNLACRHCHLDAGPHRRDEIMSRQTMAELLAYVERCDFEAADVTGGAPELVPDLPFLLSGLADRVPAVTLRSNLTVLSGPDREVLLELCRRRRIALVASLPAVTPAQVEAQRGGGVWDRSIAVLQRLNELGFGVEGSGLELHLVANPSGAFLPQGQAAAERQFKRALARRLGISFNRLFVFANVPLGRFREWLKTSGNQAGYLERLERAFNPCTAAGLMCRSLVSVAWDGTLYDCDFNQAADLPLGGRRRHLRDQPGPPEPGQAIAVADHCYACTAGSGFT